MPAEVETELAHYKELQGEVDALVAQRNKFYQQANENGMVKAELDVLEDDAQIFKLIGPVLMRQDLDEAKQNVNNRLELIQREMDRVAKLIEEKQKEQTAVGEKVVELQQGMQKAAAEAAQAAMQTAQGATA